MDILDVLIFLLAGMSFYYAGWISYKRKFYKTYRAALDENREIKTGSYNRGWLECLDFFLNELF